MWAFYVAALVMAAWIVLACIPGTPLHRWDPYPFTFLLFLGNIVQLLLMFVVLAGQRVLAVQAEEPEERRGSAEVLPGPGAGGASRPGPASRRPCTGSPVRRLSRLAPG